MFIQTPEDAYLDSVIVDLSLRLKAAEQEAERLRKKVADLETGLMREEPAMYAAMTELQMRRKWRTEQRAALDRELEEHMEC